MPFLEECTTDRSEALRVARPEAVGLARTKPHTETVRVEVYSTRHAELAKTRVAAFRSSSGCVGRRNRLTTTLVVKRTT